jgi:hypothetical protein
MPSPRTHNAGTRAQAVSVDVVHVRGRDAGPRQGAAHGPRQARRNAPYAGAFPTCGASRGAASGSPALRSAASIARQPSCSTCSPRLAERSSVWSPHSGFSGPLRVLERARDRPICLLVRTDDAARAALDQPAA